MASADECRVTSVIPAERHGSLSSTLARATVAHVEPTACHDRRGRCGASCFDGRLAEVRPLRDRSRDKRSGGDQPSRDCSASMRCRSGSAHARNRRAGVTRLPTRRRCSRIDPGRAFRHLHISRRRGIRCSASRSIWTRCSHSFAARSLRRRGSSGVDHTPLVAIAGVSADPGPDWQDGGLIQYRSGSTLHLEVEAFLEARNLKPRIVGQADDPFLLVEAAARGGYIAVVPRSVARDAVSVGRVRVLAQVEAARAGVHAVYQDGATAELARHAIEMLIDRARSAE